MSAFARKIGRSQWPHYSLDRSDEVGSGWGANSSGRLARFRKSYCEFLIAAPVNSGGAIADYRDALSGILAKEGRGQTEPIPPAKAHSTDWLAKVEPVAVAAFRKRADVHSEWSSMTRFECYLLCHAVRKNDLKLCRDFAGELSSYKC